MLGEKSNASGIETGQGPSNNLLHRLYNKLWW